MSRRFYAVGIGKAPGIYRKQKEALEQTRDFSRAKWKSCLISEEAKQFVLNSICRIDHDWLLREQNKKRFQDKVSSNEKSLKEELLLTESHSREENTLVIYTDGSIYKNFAAYAAVIVQHNQVVHQLSDSKKIQGQKCTSSLAEILAVQSAISYAIEQQKQKVVIFHDLVTLGLAAYRQANVSSPVFLAYQRFIDEALQQIDIHFVKVRGHRENPFNTLADELAKQLIGKKKKK
jgi:ribonuclease HI